MKIIVDKLPENPLECIFSRINTGVRRCAHNAKICHLTRGEECPFLTEGTVILGGVDLARNADTVEAEPEKPEKPEPKKRTSKRSTAKKDE